MRHRPFALASLLVFVVYACAEETTRAKETVWASGAPGAESQTVGAETTRILAVEGVKVSTTVTMLGDFARIELHLFNGTPHLLSFGPKHVMVEKHGQKAKACLEGEKVARAVDLESETSGPYGLSGGGLIAPVPTAKQKKEAVYKGKRYSIPDFIRLTALVETQVQPGQEVTGAVYSAQVKKTDDAKVRVSVGDDAIFVFPFR